MNLTQIVKQLWAEDGPMIAAGEDAAGGMRRLCAHCHDALPHSAWTELLSLSAVEGDEREFRVWLTDTLRDFPPNHQLKMFWFGLVEDFGTDDIGGEPLDEVVPQPAEGDANAVPSTAFIYVCGDRYLFTEPRPAERQKGYSYDPPGQQYYPHVIEQYYERYFGEDEDADHLATSYLIPAYAGLLIAGACRRLDPALLLGPSPRRQVVFGWDEGEPMILGEIAAGGWTPAFTPVKF